MCKGAKVRSSVCANGVPSATATTEEDFTKHFLRAGLSEARIVHGGDVVLEGKKNTDGNLTEKGIRSPLASRRDLT